MAARQKKVATAGCNSRKMGDYDVYGLEGSITDGGGMASYEFRCHGLAVSPAGKYEPQYARAVGKYMLNVVNAARLFYPDRWTMHTNGFPS